MMQSGKGLSMKGDAIYKGTFTNNGALLNIHTNSFTIGFAKLVDGQGNLTKSAYGNGVFLRQGASNNEVSTVCNAIDGVFGGILVREQDNLSTYPAIDDKVDSFTKTRLCRDGYVIYKEAFIGDGNTKEAVWGKVFVGDDFGVKEADGTAVFIKGNAPANTVKVGKVIAINPDDKSVTVKIDATLASAKGGQVTLTLARALEGNEYKLTATSNIGAPIAIYADTALLGVFNPVKNNTNYQVVVTTKGDGVTAWTAKQWNGKEQKETAPVNKA